MKTEKRRRREAKTDYNSRLVMLKSNLPRVVFRKTNKYILGQYVKSNEAKDKVEIGVSSKELLKYGFSKELTGSLKSLPAAYLTGFLLGKKILEKDEKAKAILDIGIIRSIPKTRTFAFLNGVVDAGVNISHKKETFPDEARIRGRHMKNNIDMDKIKGKITNE